jgi:hypothetical protein
MKTFLLLGLGLFFIIGVIIMGYAFQASDYEASNRTGNNTAYTNQTVTAVKIQYAWWGGLATLLLILAIATVFWKFAK